MIINVCGGGGNVDNSKGKLASVASEAQNLVPNNASWEITSDELNGITSLKPYIFARLTSKCTNITLPSTLTNIQEYAFSMSNIPSLVIPDSVTRLGAYSLAEMEFTNSITIGTGVTSLNVTTLFNGSAFTTLILRNNTTTAKTLSNSSIIPSTVQHIYIQAVGSVNVTTLVNNYKKATNWSSLSSKISAYTG